MKRCEWAEHESMQEYHDKDWGVPVHDDRLLFEMLILEGAQAGLSWATILKRRETYKKAFDNFDVHKIAKYTDTDKERLMQDSGIIRNKLKVKSTIINAQNVIDIQKEFGSFDKYIWQFVNGKSKVNSVKKMSDIAASTPESDVMSKDLKKRGFSFVGTTICYAYMQAVGMVNDHEVGCFRYNKVSE